MVSPMVFCCFSTEDFGRMVSGEAGARRLCVGIGCFSEGKLAGCFEFNGDC